LDGLKTAQLSTIFGSNLANDEKLRSYIIRKTFLLPFSQDKRAKVLQKAVNFSRYLLTTNPSYSDEMFIELLNVFADQSKFVEFSTAEHQLNVAYIIIRLSSEINTDDKILSDNVFKFAAETLPEVLKIPIRSRCQVAMFVIEVLMNLFKCSQNDLNFDVLYYVLTIYVPL